MKALLIVLLTSSTLLAQPWQYSIVQLNPRPYNMSWSQVHILSFDGGQTAFAYGQWDWPPVAMYDSLGERLWCLCGDPISNEIRRPHALDIFRTPTGFVTLFYTQVLVGGPDMAFGWRFGQGQVYQIAELSDTTYAFRAAHDGANSYFMCGNRNNSRDYFVVAASDSGTLWTRPLATDQWHDAPFDFCVSTNEGVAYCAARNANELVTYVLVTLGETGGDIFTRSLHVDLMGTPVKMTSDNNFGCWIIGVDDPGLPSTELHLYRSATDSYFSIPLSLTIPAVQMGSTPTLHAVPFSDGILIAGQAAIASGEECLFTLTCSASGEALIDTICGFTRVLDISSTNNSEFAAAVRATTSSDIELLRARLLVSETEDVPVIVPSTFALSAYPNPFNAQTTIQFDLPSAGDVTLKLFDLLGRDVETLVDDNLAAGTHTHSYSASHLASGVYFVRLESADLLTTHKLLLLK